MELRQLSYFVTVAEELHFGRAADRLHIVQSAVSQQVKRLERELGVDLFDRSSRHVRLTPAGERFLPEARAVLAAEQRARESVAVVDTLRLGTSTGLGERLDRVLDRLTPAVRVELVSAPAEERLQQVLAGTLDAAFVRGATGDPRLREIPMWPDQLYAALPARHPLASRSAVALGDLAALPLRLTNRRNNPPLVDLVVQACHDAGFTPKPASSGALQDTLAMIGAGEPLWTVVYAAHAAQLRTDRVAFRPLEPDLALTTSLVVRRESPTRFLKLLTDLDR
ncbi:LysR family transcriptional regulator [Fodinicola acaciae]|uniref:LysR family transcriptional regulator n=1 Tax=Fodinicola acaciae TaxID=2681555 RepID=UPI0013D22905|nr:LysR family transcriptional regulator [Fodinicola acaciae]